MKNLVHLCSDEKFIDIAIEQFEMVKNVKSIFVVCATKPIRYVKSKNIIILRKKKDVLQFLRQTPCDYVVLHSLYVPLVDILKIQRPIMWNSWGIDVYSDELSPKRKAITLSLYKPLTRKYIEDSLTIKDWLKKVLRKYYKWDYDRKIGRIEYVSTVFPEEFDYIKAVNKSIKFFPFRYITPQKNVTDCSRKSNIDEHYVLLGNSRDLTNNHLDILSILESQKEKMTVVMPVSYPQKNEKYVKKLLTFAQSLHYVNVMPIVEFMPLSDYLNLVSRCSCAFFGHIRQQAVGNISAALKIGLKVYLYEESMAYKHYSSMGCRVFSIEKDVNDGCLFSSFDEVDKLKNRLIVENEFNLENYMKKLQFFFVNPLP